MLKIRKKDILVSDVGLTQGLDSTTISAEGKYYINSSRSGRTICLSLHYSGNNSCIC